MIISFIAAIGKHNQLGKNNQLLWHIPEDLKLFKKLTMGHHMLMGRKTFDSIGKPLPGRKMLILTGDETLLIKYPPESEENVHAFSHSIEALMYARKNNVQELFVCGGAQIYNMMLPMAHRLYISHVDFDGEADAFFPEVDFSQYNILEEQVYPAQGFSQSFIFRVYEKKN